MMASRSRAQTKLASQVTIREHRIPSAEQQALHRGGGAATDSFGSAKAAPRRSAVSILTHGAFTEFDLPAKDATPIGIVAGADGNLWFAEKSANKIGRITPRGEITEFALPTPQAGPDGMILGPDGNVWFSETEVSQHRPITPDGTITEFKDGITPGSRPLSIVVRDGALWFSEAAGYRVGRITM